MNRGPFRKTKKKKKKKTLFSINQNISNTENLFFLRIRGFLWAEDRDCGRRASVASDWRRCRRAPGCVCPSRGRRPGRVAGCDCRRPV
jgi:hypothetical protein